MSSDSNGNGSRSTADLDMGQFLAHALAIENDAWERYNLLADQMIIHHNIEVALLFEQLGRYEREHAEEIQDRLEGLDPDKTAPWEFAWQDADSPEAVDFTDVHYMMKPLHALRLALEAERRAVDFFSRIQVEASDEAVQKLAAEYAEEERGHVKMVQEAMARISQVPDDWDDDMDPPIAQ